MGRPRKQTADESKVVGYIRVSTGEQADSGLGLSAQKAAIVAECDRRGWTLIDVYADAMSGKNLDRPGAKTALATVETGVAGTLMVAKLDRLTRSLQDFANLMVRARQYPWNLVALDMGVDLSTPAGEFMATVLAGAAQWERRIIGQRTRDALAVKRAQGVRLGRPARIPVEVRARIVDARRAGEGWSTIASNLNESGVPTAGGGQRWYPSTVRSVALQAAG